MASISQGRTIREFIIGLFLVPFLALVLVALIPDLVVQHLVQLLMKIPKSVFLLLFGLFTLGTVLKITKGKKTSAILIGGFLPIPEGVTPGRLTLKQGTKVVGLSKFMPGFLLAVFGVLLLHTVGGWILIHFQIVAIAPLVLYLVYGGCVALCLQIYYDSTSKKN